MFNDYGLSFILSISAVSAIFLVNVSSTAKGPEFRKIWSLILYPYTDYSLLKTPYSAKR